MQCFQRESREWTRNQRTVCSDQADFFVNPSPHASQVQIRVARSDASFAEVGNKGGVIVVAGSGELDEVGDMIRGIAGAESASDGDRIKGSKSSPRFLSRDILQFFSPEFSRVFGQHSPPSPSVSVRSASSERYPATLSKRDGPRCFLFSLRRFVASTRSRPLPQRSHGASETPVERSSVDLGCDSTGCCSEAVGGMGGARLRSGTPETIES